MRGHDRMFNNIDGGVMKIIRRLIAWLAYEMEIREKDKYYREHPEETN